MSGAALLRGAACYHGCLGYGTFGRYVRGGALLTMRNLSQLKTDGEAATVPGAPKKLTNYDLTTIEEVRAFLEALP